MATEAPPFWWEKPDWRARALLPLSSVYGAVARLRLKGAPRVRVGAPVMCVGNLTVGGAGKTPVALALAAAARSAGLSPGFLSRGHGGSFREPHRVDARTDSARHVGDEPLLLAEAAPTVVTADRAAAARLLIAGGCDFLIMDDGFQSARIHMDFALLVVDARRGLGNGHVIPGGPVRAPVLDQLRLADAVLRMGEGGAADALVRRAARAGRAVYDAVARPRPDSRVAGRRFLAFAGIGNPAKFFDSVGEAGGTVVEARSFADHHVFTDEELAELAGAARDAGLDLVTTAKDAARLRHGSAAAGAMLERAVVLEIEVAFEPPDLAERIVAETQRNWRRRLLAESTPAAG